MPNLLVVSGPNGCGKSTLTRMSAFRGLEIIDPDAIARSIASGDPLQAGREALRRRRDALAAGRSHLVETTLAGSGIFRHMTAARREGYRIVLHYVSVASPERALDRIRNRVALGGHDIPEADARRRFARSHANLPAAIARADEVLLYDNTDPDRPHREVAILKDGAWWVAEAVPGWAAEALARIGPPHRRR
ncbi:MAG: Zeta toxin family protein [Rhodospirillaceae bacterium]|nr:Zeta toxin family protein [Rhodospirillaceae bacterium]MYH39252.1 Zeta toxin family protein [Rhodospirillaceae bacterium]MYK16126.1 Zeta toxin family protein [Rhodospirillaceae bacterium]MYK58867.1 Zeta toxin family protein [Rhodospirillaceae bacterium]